MMSPALLRISLRMGKKRPFTTLLLVFGIALGVAGVVAIDIAKQSIARSFELSTSSLTAASTHQVTGSDFSIPQALFTDIRTQLGIKRSAPIIASHVKVPRLDNRTLTLMGIDPFSEQYFRKQAVTVSEDSNSLDISDLLTRPAGVLISGVFAESHGLAPHDSLILSFGRREVQAEVIGFLDDRDTDSGKALSGIIITDISTAQEILGMEDRITRLDLILKNDAEIENIRSILPQGTFLVETDRQNSALRGLSSSFETSLSAFSMLALFMGIFLIYNTVSFSVSSRKNLMGTLKALGADHRDIFKMVMLEIMVYALAGSLLGAGLGIILGKGAVQAVSATVSDMYFVLTVTQTHITPGTLFKGILAGIAASFVASALPALGASRTVPITLMQRSAPEKKLKRFIPGLTLTGGVMILSAAGFLTTFHIHPAMDYVYVFLIFAGSSLLIPAFILFSVRLLLAVFANRTPAMFRMALRNITRSLSRTSVMTASLMVVTAVYIGIDLMTASFRFSIMDWVDGHIGGHIHVSSADELQRGLDPGLVEKIKSLPEISDLSAYNIHRIYSQTSGEVHLFSYVSDRSVKHWSWTQGPEAQLENRLREGGIFVSEIFARKNQVKAQAGSQVILETRQGPVRFNVAGIFRDFFMGVGRVIVSRDTMKQYWGYDDITALQLFLHNRTDVEPVMAKIREFIPDTSLVEVISGESIKQNILEVFDKTFAITAALQVLTGLVALTGILNSILSLLLEQTREIGILRACGAEPRQTRRLLLTECFFNGFIAGTAALPFGLFLAWVLIDIVNQRSFGWTYDMVLSPGIFIQALVFSSFTALGAGIFPAVHAGRTDISKALHME
ncbi:MAG: ABC transporter permease [Desulfobacula sp.]|nr:ABC transporter permease [Desulfobacula sp.]